MKKSPEFTIVVACYNEAEHLLSSVDQLIATLDAITHNYELVFIDDKSHDATVSHLKQIKQKCSDRAFRFFFHKHNVGRGGTIAEGITLAHAPLVGFIDIDLEVSPHYISQFLKALNNGADVVIAQRNYPFRFWPVNYLVREILSRGYVIFTRMLLHHPFNDTEAGYKFFNKIAILPVLKKTVDKRWFWDTEIVLRSYLHGLTIREIPVTFERRLDKTSTVKIIPDSIEFFKQATRFYQLLNAQIRPSKGLLYRVPKVYKWVMQLYFGKNYDARYQTVVNHIEKNSSVIDVCCGDAKLYDFLKAKHVSYFGLDASRSFVQSNLKRGIRCRLSDIEEDILPSADYVVIQGSLHLFANPHKIIKKLLNSAKKTVIISESIHHVEEKGFFCLGIAKKLNAIVAGTYRPEEYFRFNEQDFRTVVNKYKPEYVSVPGGRDLIAVIRK